MPTSLRRYQREGDNHFLTFSCYHRLPYLNTPTSRNLFLDSLEQTRKCYNLQILGYVVMPEHVHLLLTSRGLPVPLNPPHAASLLSVCYHHGKRDHPMNTATAITIAALAALTPTITCLIGIILSRQDVRDLRGEMNAFRTDLDRFRAEIRDDMLTMRKDVHADLLMIHERVANVEGRQGR